MWVYDRWVTEWQTMTDAQRSMRLAHAVAALARTSRVESQGPFNATLVAGKQPNHVLHAILTLGTCLLWGIVWIIIGVTTKETRQSVMVDEYGRVYVSWDSRPWQHAPELER